MISPITKIVLKDEHVSGTHISVDAHISDTGDLVIDGCDYGEAPKRIWGDSDYEYITTVKKEYKDTVLLLLIKNKFADSVDFRIWLKENGIPNEFFNWA